MTDAKGFFADFATIQSLLAEKLPPEIDVNNLFLTIAYRFAGKELTALQTVETLTDCIAQCTGMPDSYQQLKTLGYFEEIVQLLVTDSAFQAAVLEVWKEE